MLAARKNCARTKRRMRCAIVIVTDRRSQSLCVFVCGSNFEALLATRRIDEENSQLFTHCKLNLPTAATSAPNHRNHHVTHSQHYSCFSLPTPHANTSSSHHHHRIGCHYWCLLRRSANDRIKKSRIFLKSRLNMVCDNYEWIVITCGVQISENSGLYGSWRHWEVTSSYCTYQPNIGNGNGWSYIIVDVLLITLVRSEKKTFRTNTIGWQTVGAVQTGLWWRNAVHPFSRARRG